MEPHFGQEEDVFDYENVLPDCSTESRISASYSPSSAHPDVSPSQLIHDRREADFIQPVTRDSSDVNSLNEAEQNDDLISLIRQLESERYDLLLSETTYQNRSRDTNRPELAENGPTSLLSPRSITLAGSRDPSGGEASSSPKNKRSGKSSARRLNRICQIDKEIKQLSHFLEMQERERKKGMAKTASGMTTATTSQIAAQRTQPAHHDLTLHNAVDVRSANAQKGPIMSISRPMLLLHRQDQLLATLSSLFEVDRHRMVQILLEHCSSREQCFLLYQQNIFPVVIRLIHDPSCGISESPRDVRMKAGQVLDLLVSCQPEDKRGRRERAVVEWLQKIRTYNDLLINSNHDVCTNVHWETAKMELYGSLMSLRKYSSEEDYRHCICFLGGLPAVAELLQCDFQKFDNSTDKSHAEMRVCACMILTNLTFGDGVNKALLCSSQSFLECLTHLLQVSSEELRWNAAAVIRNISWRADVTSKHALREAKMIVPLLRAAMETNSETAQKVFLSALANLSAHNDENRQAICSFDGGLAFLINRLSYESPSHNQSVVEFAGGTLRSVSCVIALRPEYRQILREHNCLKVLVSHLKSPITAWTTNACAILWNLSARCVEDQQQLFDLGAVPLLESLAKSKINEAVAISSGKAVRNLRNAETMGLIASSSSRSTGRTHTGNVPSRRARNSRRPVGNHEAQIHSADSIQTDEFASDDESPERMVSMSVPASPLVSHRYAKPPVPTKPNSSSHQTNGGFFASANHPRSTQPMGNFTHQAANIANDNLQHSFVNRCHSPPVSLTNTHSTLRLQSEHSTSQSNSTSNGWTVPSHKVPHDQYSTSSVFAQYAEPPPEDLWPKVNSNHMAPSYLYPNGLETQLGDEEGKKDYFSAPDGDDFDPENQDTIKQYNTEGTPQFSTNVSTCDLRSVMTEKPLFPFKPREPMLMPSLPVRPPVVLPKPTHPVVLSTMVSTMVSRSSTPSGMSEIDLVFGDDITEKQSVYSEYSRRPSEAVSPSDIPASPSLMRPASRNKRRILPAPPVQPRESPPPASQSLPDLVNNQEEEKPKIVPSEVSEARPKEDTNPKQSPEKMTESNRKSEEKSGEYEAEEDDMLSKLIDMGMKNASNTGSWKRSSKSKKLSIAPTAKLDTVKSLTNGTSGLQKVVSPPFREDHQLPSLQESSPSKESPVQDTLKVFSNEGMSSSASVNSLDLSVMSMEESKPNWGFNIAPAADSAVNIAANNSSIQASPQDGPQTKLSVASVDQSESTLSNAVSSTDGFPAVTDGLQQVYSGSGHPVSVDQRRMALPEMQLPSDTSFKWPQPPQGVPQPVSPRGPAVPPRISSVQPSTQFTPTNHQTLVQPAKETKDLYDRQEVTNVVSEVNEEELADAVDVPPPVPPPLVTYKEKDVSEDSACIVQDFDDDVADLLTDCIYSVLPTHATSSKRDHKSSGSGRKSGTSSRSTKHTESERPNPPSERKLRIQNSVMSRGKSDKLMNGQVASAEHQEGERSGSHHPPRSQSFDITAIQDSAHSSNPPPFNLSKERLRLPLTLPNCETQLQQQVNLQQTATSSNMTGIWVEQTNTYYEGVQNGVGAPKNSKEASTGCMDFDQISLIESGLASRFSTSEMSGDDDVPQSLRVPRKHARIVKPATKPEPRSLTEGLSKLEQPVKKVRGRGGHRSHSAAHVDIPGPINSVHATGMYSPKKEPEPDYSAMAAAHRKTVEAEVLPAPSRLMKQGTFTKDRSNGMAIPWIVPENDLTAQAAIRKRHASTTRGENITAFSREGPRSRSARSATNLVRSVSGHNLAEQLNMLSLQQAEKSVPSISPKATKSTISKSPAKKSQPVASKFASLWRKNDHDVKKKEEKKVVKDKQSGPAVDTNEGKPNGVKSPALSEKFRSSRGLPNFLSQRKSATLPKKLKNGSPVKLTNYEDRKSNGNGSVHPTTSV